MATVPIPVPVSPSSNSGGVGSAVLSSAQTGNGASTNVGDRAGYRGAALLVITTTVGATPSVLVDIQGSIDGVDWWNVPYADVSAPGTVSVAQLAAITTATTVRKILQADAPWRYLRLNYSSNTNVTLTTTVYL